MMGGWEQGAQVSSAWMRTDCDLWVPCSLGLAQLLAPLSSLPLSDQLRRILFVCTCTQAPRPAACHPTSVRSCSRPIWTGSRRCWREPRCARRSCSRCATLCVRCPLIVCLLPHCATLATRLGAILARSSVSDTSCLPGPAARTGYAEAVGERADPGEPRRRAAAGPCARVLQRVRRGGLHRYGACRSLFAARQLPDALTVVAVKQTVDPCPCFYLRLTSTLHSNVAGLIHWRWALFFVPLIVQRASALRAARAA